MAEERLHCAVCGRVTPHQVVGDEESGRLAQCTACGLVHTVEDDLSPSRAELVAEGVAGRLAE
jgi:uncharacterized Zn finger protein